MTEIIIDEPTIKLLGEMGFIQSDEDEKLYEIEIARGKARVDFRKENGRRYAMIDGKAVKPDNIPILQAFKEARDKILQSSKNDTGGNGEANPGNMGQNVTNPPILKSNFEGVKFPPAPNLTKTVWDEEKKRKEDYIKYRKPSKQIPGEKEYDSDFPSFGEE